jgi:hypothetical protein
MDETARLLAERACERLVTQYCHLVDHGEAARVGQNADVPTARYHRRVDTESTEDV